MQCFTWSAVMIPTAMLCLDHNDVNISNIALITLFVVRRRYHADMNLTCIFFPYRMILNNRAGTTTLPMWSDWLVGWVVGWLAGGLLAGWVEWRGGLKGQHDAIECNMYIHTYCMYTWIREIGSPCVLQVTIVYAFRHTYQSIHILQCDRWRTNLKK